MTAMARRAGGFEQPARRLGGCFGDGQAAGSKHEVPLWCGRAKLKPSVRRTRRDGTSLAPWPRPMSPVCYRPSTLLFLPHAHLLGRAERGSRSERESLRYGPPRHLPNTQSSQPFHLHRRLPRCFQTVLHPGLPHYVYQQSHHDLHELCPFTCFTNVGA